MKNPFATGESFDFGGTRIELATVDVPGRLDMVKEFSLAQCRAALQVADLQKTVRIAIERRIRQLEKEERQ